MENYFGLVEFFFVLLFAAAWVILEFVGKRLDRKKAAERAAGKEPAA